MAEIEAYFDESSSHDGSPVLCVAGYLYEREKSLLLDKEWGKILKEYDLPYFRMSSCAHGQGPFKSLSMDERICAAKKAIKAIKDNALRGLVTTVVEDEYNQSVGPLDPFGAAYAWCCFMSLVGVAHWADKNNYNGDIAYFFEAGHAHQITTNKIMNSIFEVEEMRQNFRYGSHSFVDKQKVRPVQSADMLAWHGATFQKRLLGGRTTPRKDFKALTDGTDTRLYHGQKKALEDYRDHLQSLPPEIQRILLGR